MVRPFLINRIYCYIRGKLIGVTGISDTYQAKAIAE